MPRPAHKAPLRDLTTYGRSHAVRLPDYDYAGDANIHVTLCAATGTPFRDAPTAKLVRDSVEFCSRKLGYTLHGYCLMPDHLHVLLSPGDSGVALGKWLQDFKSYTTSRHRRTKGAARLWQESAHDHVCRDGETAEKVLAYTVDNPVRAGLVERWQDWPGTKVFIAL